MPPLEVCDLLQPAVWFPQTSRGRYGQWNFAAPQQIRTRWKWTRKITQDRQGNNIGIDAQVIVAQDVTDGDVLWLGSLDDWNEAIYTAGSGQTPSNLMQVVSFDWTPDLKARNQRRELSLMRYEQKVAHA